MIELTDGTRAQDLIVRVTSLRISALDGDLSDNDWWLEIQRPYLAEMGLRISNDERLALIRSLGGRPPKERV